jgi:hypothetical protein
LEPGGGVAMVAVYTRRRGREERGIGGLAGVGVEGAESCGDGLGGSRLMGFGAAIASR